MWNVLNIVTGTITLSLMLFLTAIMTAIWIRNNQNLHESDINYLSRLQKFISIFYGRIVNLEKLAIWAICIDILFNYVKLYSAITLGMAAFILIFSRILANIKLLPINKQVMKWTSDYIPGKWMYLRDRWFFFHKIRTILCLLVLLFVFIACFHIL
jgi:hypothetical protein